MTGDSGAGGVKGLVPAPGSGDAAAAKFLKADGTWAVPGGTGLVSQANNTLFGNVSGSSAVPSAMTVLQAASLLGTPQTAAPGSPTSGMRVVADGTNWDPLNRKMGMPYEVMYGNSVWNMASGPATGPGKKAGFWYFPPMQMTTGSAPGQDTLKLYPVWVDQPMTISDLLVRISTVSAGGHLRIGIYASDVNHNPTGSGLGSIVVATDSLGNVSGTLSSNIVLNPGLYWFATLCDNATAVFHVISQSPSGAGTMASMIGASSTSMLISNNVLPTNGYSVSGATYASGFPDVTATSWAGKENQSQNIPMIGYKVASVP
jgi:hypothetical protein